MKQENREYMERNRRYADVILTQQYFPRGSEGMQFDVPRIIREEWQPGYEGCGNCQDTPFKDIANGYRMYNDWLEKQPKEPIRIAATFPVNDHPVMPSVETTEERKARLADPNRTIIPRKKRK